VLDPYNTTEVRSVQLTRQIDEALVEMHALKVDLIAHSQGGLDARRAISTLGYGDRVPVLVNYAVPNQGTPICDAALATGGLDTLVVLLNLLGGSVTSHRSDAEASFYSMTEDYVRNVFNPENPDDPRVKYISWTGITCNLGEDCGDVVDVELAIEYQIIYDRAGANDGIVPVESAKWGDFRGVVPADHFDEVGQLAGVTNDNYDQKEFFLERARDLRAEGY
jgi:triacylglycerol esterase/lipase EstA (alpha/beta hydrolase family)